MSEKLILIVDDEEEICSVMSEALENKGYKVMVANNGVSGLKLCAENEIDLIILDLNMPRMDGYMFLEHMRERWEKDHRRTPLPEVIILSAVDKNKDFGLAKNLGASKFLNKPFKTKELVTEVQNLLK